VGDRVDSLAGNGLPKASEAAWADETSHHYFGMLFLVRDCAIGYVDNSPLVSVAAIGIQL
jgi:hypothetical protein